MRPLGFSEAVNPTPLTLNPNACLSGPDVLPLLKDLPQLQGLGDVSKYTIVY